MREAPARRGATAGNHLETSSGLAVVRAPPARRRGPGVRRKPTAAARQGASCRRRGPAKRVAHQTSWRWAVCATRIFVWNVSDRFAPRTRRLARQVRAKVSFLRAARSHPSSKEIRWLHLHDA